MDSEQVITIVDKVKDVIALYGLDILSAIAILIIGRIVAGLIKSLIAKMMKRAGVEETLVKFSASLAYVGLMAFVIVAALGRLGIQTTSFIAILGAAGLAVGLALQGSLANFAAGVLMMIFKPFKVGDFVEAGGAAGVVEEISIFTTILKTPDNRQIIVPNAAVTGGNITNVSANDTRRVDLVVGVSYGDDLKKVRATLERILNEEERILKDPAYTIAVLELADSSVNFAVRPWVKATDYWGVFFDLNEKIKITFDEEGISIPFPQVDSHIFQMGAA